MQAFESQKDPEFHLSLGYVAQDPRLPLYTIPAHSPYWVKNKRMHKMKRPQIVKKIKNIMLEEKIKQRSLAREYRKLDTQFRLKLQEENRSDDSEASTKANIAALTETVAALGVSDRVKRRRDVCRSDYEEQQMLQKLMDEEKKRKLYEKSFAPCPAMHITDRSRRYESFKKNTNNRLTTDRMKMK